MPDVGLAWVVVAGLAAPSVAALFVLVMRLDLNHRAFAGVLARLLAEQRYDRVEKLLAAIPHRPPVMALVEAAWRKRAEPAPFEPGVGGGYREAQAPPSYAERMKITLAADRAQAEGRVRRAFLSSLPSLLAPLGAWWSLGPPPPFGGPWILASIAVVLVGLAGLAARKILRAFDPTLDVILPGLEDAP